MLKQYPASVLFMIVFILFIGVYYLIFKIFPGEISLLYSYYVVKEQMDVADKVFDEMENDVLSIYLKMRKDAKGCSHGLITDEETKRFQVLSKFLIYKSLNLVRYFFRENHLADMEEKDFNCHASERAELIMRKLRELMLWYILN